MRLEQHISLKQTQSLALTPQMQQAIHLLQLSSLDLQDYINTQIIENPFLECDTFETVVVTPPEKPSVLSALEDESYSNFWTDTKTVSSKYDNLDKLDWINETVSIQTSLHDHLHHQLRAATTNKQIIHIGNYLIDLVNEEGYIKADLEEVAYDLNVSYSDILATLNLLQTFDPIGVCARTLEECLMIQLRESNQLNSILEKTLSNLSLVTETGISGLMRKCDISKEQLSHALDIIKGLNPKPGLAIHTEPTQVVIPDLIFKRQHDHWYCELNEAALPKVFVNSQSYHQLLMQARQQKDKAYISERFKSARWLGKTVAQRAETMLRVGNFIAEKQQDYLEHGRLHLKPMTLKDLSTALEMHESTIARTVSNKYIHTFHGIVELKSLFSASVSQDYCDLSNKVIQYSLEELINSEDKSKPLSDDQLVRDLAAQGITIARRTVSKYREAMKIPSSYARKKQAQLMTF